MKPLMLIFCLVLGHNKVLETRKENGYTIYYNVCTQCEMRRINKQLSEKPKALFKVHCIKMRAHGQKIVVKTIPISVPRKKSKVNFYVL